MSQAVSITNYTPAARYDDEAWKEILVEEGATSAGSWTLIDTLTLDPVDEESADPQARNLTTLEASDTPGLWYRFTPRDEDGNTGQPSAPIQNTARPAAFATSDDFAARLGLTLTTEEASRADTLLEFATGLIQDEAKQTISLVEDDELTLVGTTDERILLPERPVVSVASVTLDGVALAEGGGWYRDGNEIVRRGVTIFTGLGLIDGGLGRGFGWASQTLTVVYTHGYETVPELVKAICVEMVNRVWVNPGGVIQEQIGDTNTTYAPYAAPPRGLLLTDSEQKAIRRMFGRQARSITIGG